MITFAKLKHLESKKFKDLFKEIQDFHKKVDYFFDWSRQWEYPWVLENTPLKKNRFSLRRGWRYLPFSELQFQRKFRRT